jgi:hypothetical protein
MFVMDSQKVEMSAAWQFVRSVQAAWKHPDGPRFSRLVVRRLTQALLAHVGSERPATFECTVELTIVTLFPLQVLRLRFNIDDWTMVPVAEATTLNQSLRIEAFSLRERDGLDTYGMVGLHENKPLISITAAQAVETLFVRIGGFDRSILAHDGVLNSSRRAR